MVSVDKVLSIKMYSHAIRFHKLVYEELHRFLLNVMEDNDVNSFELSSAISDMQEKVNDPYKNITQVSHDDLIESYFFEQFNNVSIDYKKVLCIPDECCTEFNIYYFILYLF